MNNSEEIEQGKLLKLKWQEYVRAAEELKELCRPILRKGNSSTHIESGLGAVYNEAQSILKSWHWNKVTK